MPLLLLLLAVAFFALALILPGVMVVLTVFIGWLLAHWAWILGAVVWFGVLGFLGSRKAPQAALSAWFLAPLVAGTIWVVVIVSG